ncbi:MAG: response regulator [Usitatibacteraceae bacterium]
MKPGALVIEDDEAVAEHVAQVLRKMGYDVEYSLDGLDALRVCQAGSFDVIICDVRMPRLSGISFLSNLGKTASAGAKVIMISALDDNSIRNQSLALGATAYLVKPLVVQELRDAIGAPRA